MEIFPAKSVTVQVILLVEFHTSGKVRLNVHPASATESIVETQFVSDTVALASVNQFKTISERFVLIVQVWLRVSSGATLS